MKKLLAILAILVLSIIGVSATADITYNAENVQSFNALAYTCANEDCSQVTSFTGSLPANTNNGQLTVKFPETLASNYGYAVYFTSPGYFPHAYHATWAGNGATSDSFEFSRGSVCKAKVDEFTVVNDVVENVPLTIITQASLDATTEGAFSLTNHPVKYIPLSLKEYYNSDVRVTLMIRNSNGQLVKTQSTNLKIMAGENQRVEFAWTPQQSGEYTLTVTTEVLDDQCESSEQQRTSKAVTVLEEGPRNMCYTLLNGLKVDVESNEVTANLVSAQSYHANDFLFVDSRYQLTEINTALKWQFYTVNGESVSSGSNTATLTPGNYVVEVTGEPSSVLCAGLTSLNEKLEVAFSVAAPKTYTVNFAIVDPSGTSVEGVNVELGGASRTTDSNGRVSYSGLTSGTYDYTVSKTGYKDVTGSLDVNGDRTVSLVLDFTEPVSDPQPPVNANYDVTFKVLNSATGLPVEDVKIIIAGTVGHTGSNGKVIFQGLTNGNHAYTLTHADYEARSDSITVAGKDVSLTLNLERVTGVSDPVEVSKPKIKNSQKNLFVSSVRIPSAFELSAGETVTLVVNTANKGEVDLENVKVSAVIQELGVRATSTVADLDEGDRTAQKLRLTIPENTSEGLYYVRISLDSNHAHRVLYREIEVI
ncbi:hypothetical protein COV11_00950 [Candidatus Woesearchaeota archaeon CG10_big_fil_rev_8_21_14_0_10_30_7]|nr:MAG: hypothetical protein COV11_00950 [Candidatus Woesearchaeota archaeon CG10_big_fil_rev_8_21_14_0_10_30_7]